MARSGSVRTARWRLASVVAPDTTIRCAHVPRRGRAIGEPVAQVHGALRSGHRRFEKCDVRGHRATVEHLLADAEHDRVHPQVETVEELLAQEGLHQVQAPDDLDVFVPVPDLAHRAGQVGAKMSYVRRPSRRASVPSYAAMTCAPATSSTRGACQPPNGNPSGSSSGPPGACPTRSRVANISMWMRPMPCSRSLMVVPSRGRPAGAGELIAATPA